MNQLWDRQSDDRQVAMLKTKPFHTLDDTDLSLFSSNIVRITDIVSQQRLVLFQRLISFVDKCMDNQTQSSMPSSTQTIMLALSCQALFTESTLGLSSVNMCHSSKHIPQIQSFCVGWTGWHQSGRRSERLGLEWMNLD